MGLAQEEFNVQLYKLQSLFEQEVTKSSSFESRLKAVLKKEEEIGRYKQETAIQLQELLRNFAEQAKLIDVLQAKENCRKEEVKNLQVKLKTTVTEKEEMEQMLAKKDKHISGISELIKSLQQLQKGGFDLTENYKIDDMELDKRVNKSDEINSTENSAKDITLNKLIKMML